MIAHLAALVALQLYSAAVPSTAWKDPSPHLTRMVRVAPQVDIETLDWGGHGRALVLIAGSGSTAHVFDDFAALLTPDYHVYGVTRRGYGKSSAPKSGYTADRLGDDVVAVIEALHIDKPILMGHSFGGQEVSDVATRFPQLVSGAVYLDAVYSYDAAYDDEALYWNVEWKRQVKSLQEHLAELLKAPDDPKPVALKLRDEDLPQVTRIAETLVRVENGRHGWVDPGPDDLTSFAATREWYHRLFHVYLPEAEFRQILRAAPDGRPTMQYRSQERVNDATKAGRQAFHDITVPALYIGAAQNDPGDFDANDPEARANAAAYIAFQNGWIARRSANFLQYAPNGRVVIMQRASHFVFLSNEDDVLREISVFAASLPPLPTPPPLPTQPP
jgi:non-heme chloroperoxidase